MTVDGADGILVLHPLSFMMDFPVAIAFETLVLDLADTGDVVVVAKDVETLPDDAAEVDKAAQ